MTLRQLVEARSGFVNCSSNPSTACIFRTLRWSFYDTQACMVDLVGTCTAFCNGGSGRSRSYARFWRVERFTRIAPSLCSCTQPMLYSTSDPSDIQHNPIPQLFAHLLGCRGTSLFLRLQTLANLTFRLPLRSHIDRDLQHIIVLT